jgi:hypothetical protein
MAKWGRHGKSSVHEGKRAGTVLLTIRNLVGGSEVRPGTRLAIGVGGWVGAAQMCRMAQSTTSLARLAAHLPRVIVALAVETTEALSGVGLLVGVCASLGLLVGNAALLMLGGLLGGLLELSQGGGQLIHLLGEGYQRGRFLLSALAVGTPTRQKTRCGWHLHIPSMLHGLQSSLHMIHCELHA